MKKLYPLLLLTLFIGSNLNAQYYSKPLLIMDTISGNHFDLTFQEGSWNFYPTRTTSTFAYNGDLLGPTLFMNNGDSVHITVHNATNDTTTTHWHGLHVPANVDGTHYNKILPGETWRPSFKIDNKAATYWYHPHLYKKTNLHVSKGASGLLIIRDNEEASKELPRTYGVDDIPIVIQSKIINQQNGQVILNGAFDTTMTINGIIRPYLEVPAQPVRFRMLNGASRRVFMPGFSNDMDFYQIATDGSLTPKPRKMNRVRLSNGERTEIVADFTGMQDSVFYFMCYGTELGSFVPGGATGGNGNGANPYDSADYAMMEIRVVAPINPTVFDPNQTLTTIDPIALTEVDTTREVVFRGGVGTPFVFDDQPFMHNLINHRIPIGNTEIWELRNTTFLGHPFHIHDVQFQILDKEDGQPVPEFEQGWKDVVFVEGFSTARFITRFKDFADTNAAYMYHCHNLAHEDEGMMAQFIVYDTATVTNIKEYKSDIEVSLYPNPAERKINVSLSKTIKSGSIQIINMLGKEVFQSSISNGLNHEIDISKIQAGVYILKIRDKNSLIYSKKLIKKE